MPSDNLGRDGFSLGRMLAFSACLIKFMLLDIINIIIILLKH